MTEPSPAAAGETFPVLRVGEIPREEPRGAWLIEGLWAQDAVGLIGGHPKSGKTFLALDMAVSVASGTECLGRFRVLEPGRAVVYLAEDSLQAVRQRSEALCRHRGLGLADLELHVITTPSLQLDLPAHRARLSRTLALLRPRLLLLDPLVRLHARNENDASEISELLGYLRCLQRQLHMAVVVVHHVRKNALSQEQAGQNLRGSGDLWAWSDSALYLRRTRGALVLAMEHRAARAPEPVCLRLVDTLEDQVRLEVVAGYSEGQGDPRPPLRDAVLDALGQHSPMTREELRRKLSVKNERLGEVLRRLQTEGRILRQERGWRLATGRSGTVPRSHP